MSRDYKVYLEDILEGIRKIDCYTEDMALKDFSKDDKTLDAVVRNLEVMARR